MRELSLPERFDVPDGLEKFSNFYSSSYTKKLEVKISVFISIDIEDDRLAILSLVSDIDEGLTVSKKVPVQLLTRDFVGALVADMEDNIIAAVEQRRRSEDVN